MVLAGRNATNRASLLRAVIAAIGSANVSTKDDTEKPHVEMTLDGLTYTCTFEQHNGTVALVAGYILKIRTDRTLGPTRWHRSC